MMSFCYEATLNMLEHGITRCRTLELEPSELAKTFEVMAALARQAAEAKRKEIADAELV